MTHAGWSRLERVAGAAHSRHPDDEFERASADPAHRLDSQPVSLGAHCRLCDTADKDVAQNFAVSEFVAFEDGARLMLHDDRGFTLGSNHADGHRVSRTQLIDQVLSVVLPDDDDSLDEHPWNELVEQASAAGVDVSESVLRKLPYMVLLADDVEQWLTAGASRS